MNKSKQLDLSRKRNEQLSRQLEKIKTDWLHALEDIQKKREEYELLIADIKAMRKGMGSKKRKKRGGFYGGL